MTGYLLQALKARAVDFEADDACEPIFGHACGAIFFEKQRGGGQCLPGRINHPRQLQGLRRLSL